VEANNAALTVRSRLREISQDLLETSSYPIYQAPAISARRAVSCTLHAGFKELTNERTNYELYSPRQSNNGKSSVKAWAYQSWLPGSGRKPKLGGPLLKIAPKGNLAALIQLNNYCQKYFGFNLPSVLWAKLMQKFEVKFGLYFVQLMK